jgi:hypothetical protein
MSEANTPYQFPTAADAEKWRADVQHAIGLTHEECVETSTSSLPGTGSSAQAGRSN